MPLYTRLLLTLLWLPLSTAASEGERQPIDWVLWPIPSAVIVVDGEPVDGTAVRGLQLLMDELPQFKANFRLGNRLRQQRDMQRAQRIAGSPSGENLLRMVSHGRIDLTFEFSSVTQAFTRHTMLPEPLYSLPVAEHRELVITGIYCTRSAWGERVIAELEQGVRRISANPLALLDIYRQWVPQETFEAFEKQLLDYYAGRGLSP